MEMFKPLELLGLNEPRVSSIVLQFMKDNVDFEEKIAKELATFAELQTETEVKNVCQIIDIVLELN
jgi:hypothetical protein